MTRVSLTASMSLLACLAVACDAQRSPPTSDGEVAINVAPLTLPGVDEACYGLVVRAGAGGPIIWQKSGICSTRYGDGLGDIAYVGTCNAGEPAEVELVLESLSDTTRDLVAGTDFVNPCQGESGAFRCLRPATCVANADVPVTFDLTVMRRADQGFFDVAVTLDDVFCSAKVDCLSSMLFNGTTRAPTVVLAVACTSGAGAQTNIYMDDVVLDCGVVGQLPLSPVGALGSHGPIAQTPIFDWAIYTGQGDQGNEEAYWNFALGIAGDFPACTLRTRVTASQTPLVGNSTPANAVYPVIDVAVPLNGSGGALSCGHHALDGSGSLVKTGYVTNSTCFRNRGEVGNDDVALTRSSCAPGVASQAGGSSIVGTNAVADGTTASTITITLKNDIGGAIVGVVPTFAASGSGNTVGSCSSSDASGLSTCTLRSTVAETKTLSLLTPGAFAGGSVTFSTPPSGGDGASATFSTITGTSPVQANSFSTSTITITLKDASNLPVAGVVPTFSATGSGNLYDACSSTNASGVSTCTMRATLSGTKTLRILTPVNKTGGSVTFTAGCVDTQPGSGTDQGCFSATPVCVFDGTSSSCVQCQSSNECPGGATCSAAHQCLGWTQAFDTGNVGSSYGLALADLNEDGKVDVAVGGHHTGSSNDQQPPDRVYTGNGDNTFSLFWTSTFDHGSRGIGWFDADSDGDLDLMSSNGKSGQYSLVVLNDGNDVWDSVDTWQGPIETPNAMSVGDLNGDGHMDALIGGWGQGLAVVLGQGVSGSGMFTAGFSIDGTSWDAVVADIELVDLDGQHGLDFVVANDNGASRAYLNDGSGGFTMSWESSGMSSMKFVTSLDLDGDGDKDLVFGGNSGGRMWLNDGTGVFTASTTLSGRINGVGAGDLDRDTRDELVIVYTNRFEVRYFATPLTINVTTTLPNGEYNVVPVNLDGDARWEILMGYASDTDGRLRVWDFL